MKIGILRGCYTGAAWPSSARVVRCRVKSQNERNPYPMLHVVLGNCLGKTRRKVGMTSGPHSPYVLGYTRATMVDTTGSQTVRWSKSFKVNLSSDWGLKLDLMKLDSLVIADQQCCGEYVLGSCTHRPSRHGSKWYPKAFSIYIEWLRSCL